MSRAPQGARGLKFGNNRQITLRSSRAPQGARGLKSCRNRSDRAILPSRPARGAWVEIYMTF